ncbi:MAG TPA: HlyD family type I secretion periplasmic adaptor subunit, partial [Rhodospirillales bacterium]|nr:HlyD family type I secretion periplasmic adaptor subunit [Rhodospirillales bacterium]
MSAIPQLYPGPEGTDLETERIVGRAPHVFLVLCAFAVIAFFVWASIGTLNIVSLAVGEVIPSSQIKTVQHLEGGIVRAIMVKEGDKVVRGQPLATLEKTASGADVGELHVRIVSLRLEIARLLAEADGEDNPDFDAELRRDNPDLVGQAQKMFAARKKRRASQLTGYRQAVVQRRQQIEEISVRIRNQKNGLKLQKERIVISNQLLKNDLTNRYEHLDLLKEANRLEGGIEEDKSALNQAKAALKESQAKLEGFRGTINEETRKELDASRRSLNELSKRMEKFADQLQRKVLRSPVDGVIKTLYISTVGGVLQPGEKVADIVPGADRLVIEAKLPTRDIGYVQDGQAVMVKLASRDATRFGGLNGTVVNVSPDTLVNEDGKPFYKVRIETEDNKFQRGNLQYRLFPGMQVVASIQT